MIVITYLSKLIHYCLLLNYCSGEYKGINNAAKNVREGDALFVVEKALPH